MADDDPMSVPLDVGVSKVSLRTLALGGLALFLLPLWLPLILFLPAITLTAGCCLWLLRPTVLHSIRRDVSFVVRLVSATRQLKKRLKVSGGRFTAADYWTETVAAHGHKEALIFGERSLTYAQVDAEANRVAQWALQRGLRSSDTVGLLCGNRPEHLFIWIGLAKIGITTALINPGLRGASLKHALGQSAIHTLLFDADAAPTVKALSAEPAVDAPSPPHASPCLVCIDTEGTRQVSEAGGLCEALDLPASPQPPPDCKLRATCKSTDAALLIYTSGTTGLPKAARVNHIRFFSAIVIGYMFRITGSDRLYCCLPLCHTAAIGGLSLCWWLGIPMILAPKFSASSFWRECTHHRATVVQYVGELCRFLAHSPPSAHDRAHSVRLAFGNGLRPDVWPLFKSRFGIPQIGEVYASTEGNANLANTEVSPA